MLFPDSHHHFISCRLPHFPEVSEREEETGKETEKDRDCENGSGIKRARLRRMRRKSEWWMWRVMERKVMTRRTTDAMPSHLVTCPEQEQTKLYHIFTILLLYFSIHLAGWKLVYWCLAKTLSTYVCCVFVLLWETWHNWIEGSLASVFLSVSFIV